MPSIYALKPRFQSLLRPLVRWLAGIGVRANGVTIFATCFSVAVGAVLALNPKQSPLWLILPVALLVRMALNAMDGMLAREFGQQSMLGGFLNDAGDIVSDIALALPFVFFPGFERPTMISAIVLAAISEFCGHRERGPMGKSDRAFMFGIVAYMFGTGGYTRAIFTVWFPRFLVVMILVTMLNRLRTGVPHAQV
jgi:CDP-diacylglycerol--glycerol-3-phosphate 3-phosphatidyltransferase